MNCEFSKQQAESDLIIQALIYDEVPAGWEAILDDKQRIYWCKVGELNTRIRPKAKWYNDLNFKKEGLGEVVSFSGRPAGLEGNCNLCLTTWNELRISTREESIVHGCLVVGDPFSAKKFALGTGIGKKVESVSGLLPVLKYLLEIDVNTNEPKVWISATLCVASVNHVCSVLYDVGYGCTYRTLQMIFSSLSHLPAYSKLSPGRLALSYIPTITEIQIILELAWASGYDDEACRMFAGRVRGSKRWLCMRDMAIVLTYLDVRFKIVTFNSSKGKKAYNQLLNFFIDYFECSQTLASRGFFMSTRQPVYLEMKDHCVAVIGVTKKVARNVEVDLLLVFDSACATKTHLVDAVTFFETGSPGFVNHSISGRKDLLFEYELAPARCQDDTVLSILFVENF